MRSWQFTESAVAYRITSRKQQNEEAGQRPNRNPNLLTRDRGALRTMCLKPSFLNTDFRHHQLVLSFVPFVIWIGAAVLAFFFWHHRWALPSAILLFCLGALVARKLPWAAYALASRSLASPLKGSPGTNFLLFHSESPETLHKLKILPEDAGFLYAENGCYRIMSLKHDLSVPFGAFHHEPIKKGASAKALLLRFRPSETEPVVELAATFDYFGKDLEVAADSNRKCEWASKVIESMKLS